MNEQTPRRGKRLILPFLLLLLILPVTTCRHGYDDIGEFVSLENVRELSAFDGREYVSTPEEYNAFAEYVYGLAGREWNRNR